MSTGAPLAVFRADAGSTIGWGHIMRCSALAVALRDAGWRCAWASASDDAAMTGRLATRFDEVMTLAPDRDEPTQMRAHWPDDCRLLVVDHYDRDAGFETSCRGWADSILAIDDLAEREHDCDLFLDSAPGTGGEARRHRLPTDAVALLGPAYALLMPGFAADRRRLLPRRYEGGARRILVGVGATNPKGILDTSLDAIERASVGLVPDLVLAWNTPDREHLVARVERLGGKVHVDVDNMAALMSGVDIALGASGVSAWERCALGLPTLLLVIADNQRANAEALAAAGAARIVEPDRDLLAAAIDDLAGDSALLGRMSRAASRLTDGLGAIRVRQAVGDVPRAGDGRTVHLRPATSADSAFLLDLQRRPETRRFARNPEIPNPAEHESWMRGRLDDPGCVMNVIMHGEVPAGVARLDRLSKGYEVSIAVDPSRFRLGIGGIVLALLHQLAPEADLWAHVQAENTASRVLFERAGYREAEKRDWYCQRALS